MVSLDIIRDYYKRFDIAMCSKHLGATLVIAWPTAEIAVMGSEGAANIIFRREIKESDDPEATRKEMVMKYEEKFANPYAAASKGYVDQIIEPGKTREALIAALRLTKDQREEGAKFRHGNIPL